MARTRRVVITGMGVMAPGRNRSQGVLGELTAGRTATRTITLFDASGFRSRIAAECDFDPVGGGPQPAGDPADGPGRAVRRRVHRARRLPTADWTQRDYPPGRIGVSIGSAVGCTMGLEEEYVVLSDGGRRWLVDHCYAVPHLYGYMVPSTLASEVARARRPRGRCAGLDRVHLRAGRGRPRLRSDREGTADVVIAGATEAPISPITSACFDAIKATSPNNDDPAHASRPFDARRDGFVLGEGAAVLVLEERAAAQPARRSCLCRDRRLCRPRQRVPHDRAEARRAGDGRGDPLSPCDEAEARRRGHRLHQRAWFGHQAERPARDRRLQAHASATERTRCR